MLIKFTEGKLFFSGDEVSPMHLNLLMKESFGLNFCSTLLPCFALENGFLTIESSYTNFPQIFVIVSRGYSLIKIGGGEAFFEEIKSELRGREVNRDSFFESVFFAGSTDGSWIYEGTYLLAPNSRMKIYKDYSLSVERKELENHVQLSNDLDYSVNIYSDKLSSLFGELSKCGRKLYLGISGGLDSRIALHFLNSSGIKFECFYIGKKQGRFGILTGDYLSAKKICDLYNKELFVFDPNDLDLYSRFKLDLSNNPFGTSEVARIHSRLDIFDRNILVNGAWGYWVQKQCLILEEIDELLETKTLFNARPYGDLILRFLARIGLLQEPSKKSLREEFPSVYKILISRLEGWLMQNGRSISSSALLDEWNVYVLGSRASSGVFESALGKSYPISIYAEIMPELNSQIPTEFHMSRRFLKRILEIFCPQLLDIPGQGGRSFNSNFLSSLLGAIRQVFAGHGVMDYRKQFKLLAQAKNDFICSSDPSIKSLTDDLSVNKLENLVTKGRVDASVYLNYIKLLSIVSSVNR